MPEITSKADLVDICEVLVDKSLPKRERITEYIRQIKDPYHFRCGEIAVTAVYQKDGPPFEECLGRIIPRPTNSTFPKEGANMVFGKE